MLWLNYLKTPVLKTQRGQFTGTFELTLMESEHHLHFFISVLLERIVIVDCRKLQFVSHF